MKLKGILTSGLFCGIALNAYAQSDRPYHEPYRPQMHFSPLQHWINDPNGMVYFDNTYHLFFQYYPGGTTWGPMHWGHATSEDLIHWKELPIALYPDDLGYIFSGSAVVDSNNTSGFGKDGKIPLIAIFTHHDPKGEKAGANNFQNQSIAYSLDGGNTWTKYADNPVLKNPGIKDFRDPKVMWYAPAKKWIMTLATKDRVTFYSSADFKMWQRESDFGKGMGAHGGVWECPDLFPLTLHNKTYWVLIGNINPGGPNGGSATQYFIGQFDGNKFTPADGQTRWLDYGPDDYAGITWSNTGARKIFLGWMSNWTYANQVPTEKWRNAMTIPRELGLKKVNNEILLTSLPVKELAGIENAPVNVSVVNSKKSVSVPPQFVLKLTIGKTTDSKVILSNTAGDTVIFGFDKQYKRYYLDRSKSGKVDFNPTFATMNFAPCFSKAGTSEVELIVDASSMEVFADGGLTVMTGVFFPHEPMSQLRIISSSVKAASIIPLRSIW
jgi:fructan beta-fructosidase